MAAFRPADKIAKENGVNIRRTACAMCGDPAEAVCWACLDATIETAVERMAREGKLDDALRRVIEQARG